jgi:hypothetical protein
MGWLMIVVGALLGAWAFFNYRRPQAQRTAVFQGTPGIFVHKVCAAGAVVLVVLGVIKLLFS